MYIYMNIYNIIFDFQNQSFKYVRIYICKIDYQSKNVVLKSAKG